MLVVLKEICLATWYLSFKTKGSLAQVSQAFLIKRRSEAFSALPPQARRDRVGMLILKLQCLEMSSHPSLDQAA